MESSLTLLEVFDEQSEIIEKQNSVIKTLVSKNAEMCELIKHLMFPEEKEDEKDD